MDAVVDGTVQRSGNRVRMTVQLVRVDEDGAAWSASFEEEMTSLFAVQDAIAEQVARALDLELRGADRAVLARRDTADVSASQAYLKGRYFWSRFTGEWMGRAFACFQEAVERDPAYALPHAGLADAYLVLGFSGLLRSERGLAARRGVGAHRAAAGREPRRRPHLAGLRAAVPRLGLAERPRVAEARAGAEPRSAPRTSGTACSWRWKGGSTTRGARSSARSSWSRSPS